MKKLMEILEDRMMSQTADSFAAEIGVNAAAVSHWRRGRSPEFESCCRIAVALGLDPREIMVASGVKKHVELWDRLRLPRNEPSSDPLEEELVFGMKRILSTGDNEATRLLTEIIRYVEKRVMHRR